MTEYDKFDLNKDGKVDSQDIYYATDIGRTEGNQPSAVQTYDILKTGGNLLAPMLSNPAINFIGRNIASFIDTNTTSRQVMNKLPEMLKTNYEFTDAEVTEWIKANKVKNEINDKSGGKLNEIESLVKDLNDSVTGIYQLKNGGQVTQIPTIAAYITGKGGKNVPQGVGPIASNIESIVNNATGNKNVQPTINELQKKITDISTKLGISPDVFLSASNNNNYQSIVNTELEKYKGKYGLYSFGNGMNVDSIPLSTEQKQVMTNVQNLVVNKIMKAPAGTAEQLGIGASTLPADTTQQTNTGATGVTTQSTTGTTTGSQYGVKVDNGDGTYYILEQNASGTDTKTIYDSKTDEKISSDTNVQRTYDWTQTGTGSTNPNAYIALNSTDPKRYDSNGNVIQGEAKYTYGQVNSYLNSMSASDIMSLKKKLYAGGYYGSSDIVSVLSGNLSEADTNALTLAMGDANLNGLSVEDSLAPKYKTYLLTGRPAGEKAVDLNGDGIVDETSASALKSFLNRNGLSVSDGYVENYNNAIVNGQMTLDDAMKTIREKMIAPANPAWADQIKSGMDVADIASPYIEKMATMLGMKSENINMNDPIIQKALNGRDTDGKAMYKSLFEFENDVRHDPRWTTTPDGQKQYADTAKTVLQTFGFMG